MRKFEFRHATLLTLASSSRNSKSTSSENLLVFSWHVCGRAAGTSTSRRARAFRRRGCISGSSEVARGSHTHAMQCSAVQCMRTTHTHTHALSGQPLPHGKVTRVAAPPNERAGRLLMGNQQAMGWRRCDGELTTRQDAWRVGGERAVHPICIAPCCCDWRARHATRRGRRLRRCWGRTPRS